MPHDVIMPALGMAQDTGLIVAWHKSPGDAVKTGDVLFEVETDKATMEVEAQADGFLTQVRAHAGDDVPVGDVIAVIGKTTEAVHTQESPAAAVADTTDVPAGSSVIMPALGMAQDTGLIVAWHKSPGDAVAANDILFEVETDKSTVEVEAGFDGFVVALLAEAGEEAPVGETIAVIAAEKHDNPVQKSRSGGATPTALPAAPAPTPAKSEPAESVAPAAKAPAPARADGRILASPKARRLALEQGLDLNLLVKAGHPQPYGVADLDVLRALPIEAATGPSAKARRLTADLPNAGFDDFAAWAGETAGLTDTGALLAGLAAASLGRGATVSVETFGKRQCYTVPIGPLAEVAPAEQDTPADLVLRDLRNSRIATVELGPEDTPVLTLTRTGVALNITLEAAAHQLTAADAVDLLSNFAGRMEQPLRHLL